VCVAGGWAGGSAKDDGIFDSVQKMWEYNVQSAVTASHIAARSLVPGGTVIFTGANAARVPTPGPWPFLFDSRTADRQQ
jgi:dihydropteridine reductase